jgi:hypothetical protein
MYKVGETVIFNSTPHLILAIAQKYDNADILVVLAKSGIREEYHEVWHIAKNAPEDRKLVDDRTDYEIALAIWMDRAFGVNIF